MAQYKNFGEFLQKKREAKQITLRKMAEMLDITAPYLSDIEKDRRNPPDMDKLDQISTILLLSDEDRTLMFDLAGKKRNSVAPDLPEYIMGRGMLLPPCVLPETWTLMRPTGLSSLRSFEIGRGNLAYVFSYVQKKRRTVCLY